MTNTAPFVIVSGLLGLAARRSAVEQDALDPASSVAAARLRSSGRVGCCLVAVR